MRAFFSLAMVMFLVACGQKGPPPLTLDQVPEALRKSFASARLQPKKNAEAVAALVADKQYAVASIQLQALLEAADISREQRDTVSAALVTVNETLAQIAGATEPTKAGEEALAPAPAATPQQVEEAKAVRQHYIMTK